MTLDALSAAVALNRETDFTPISFEPPLIPLLDLTHCSAWGEELKKHATKWEVRKATVDLWHQIPDASGLYMFVWRPPLHFQMEGHAKPHAFSWVLYLGLAGAGDSKNTLKVRYKNEYAKYLHGDPARLFAKSSSGGRSELFKRWLLLQPLEYWWAEVRDTDRLFDLEKHLIKLLAPPLNIHHNRKLRARENTRRAAI